MLSEEEKKLLKIFKAQVEEEETEYFSVNAYTQLLYDSHKTVLNLITKLQKENEKKDKRLNRQFKLLNKKNKEIKLKDNQIDLMAEKINEAYFEENDFYLWFEKIFGIIPKGNYEEKIKQYFETKTKGE